MSRPLGSTLASLVGPCHRGARCRMLASIMRLGPNDCMQCGACCCNAKRNVEEGVHHWVAIDKKALIWRRKDLVKRLVVYDQDEKAHLKLTPTGECAALRGKVGRSVRCSVYHHRPHPCRRVMPGDPECLRARQERLS